MENVRHVSKTASSQLHLTVAFVVLVSSLLEINVECAILKQLTMELIASATSASMETEINAISVINHVQHAQVLRQTNVLHVLMSHWFLKKGTVPEKTLVILDHLSVKLGVTNVLTTA